MAGKIVLNPKWAEKLQRQVDKAITFETDYKIWHGAMFMGGQFLLIIRERIFDWLETNSSDRH